MRPNKQQLAFLCKLEKWAKNNKKEARGFTNEFDEVFKDNLRPFSIQNWVKDCMLIDVEPALSNLIGRLEDAKRTWINIVFNYALLHFRYRPLLRCA